ncbi:hypothetical protein HYV89_01455 [Candidatus Woesearchaeota archaeon]|nr:hypothetical protein [Candidatus Woesearchaeota archaeon]
MSKRHLKSIAAPKSWPIKRKKNIFVIRPNPGPHKLEDCMPIGLVLKMLSQVKNTNEAKHVINSRKVLINKKPAEDIKSQVGLLDVLEFADKSYRVLLDKKGKLLFKEISKSDANITLLKIIKKTKLTGSKFQLNFHNGFNMMAEKNDVKANDVLVIEGNKVKEKIGFDKGSTVYIIKGKNMGKTAKIENVGNSSQVALKIDDKKISLPKNYVFLIGKEKPIISVLEK